MNLVPLCTNQSVAAIFPEEGEFSSLFLYHYLDSQYDKLRELSAGDGGRGGLNLSIIRKIVVPFPGLVEQEAIASILSELDESMGALRAKLAKARDLKQAMMQALLTGRIRLVPPAASESDARTPAEAH